MAKNSYEQTPSITIANEIFRLKPPPLSVNHNFDLMFGHQKNNINKGRDDFINRFLRATDNLKMLVLESSE